MSNPKLLFCLFVSRIGTNAKITKCLFVTHRRQKYKRGTSDFVRCQTCFACLDTNRDSYRASGLMLPDMVSHVLPFFRIGRETPEAKKASAGLQGRFKRSKTNVVLNAYTWHAKDDDDDDYFEADSNPEITLEQYLRVVETTEAAVADLLKKWKIPAPLSIKDKDGSAISGRWLEYDDNPPLIIQPNDNRNVLAWDTLLYGFPVVAALEKVKDRFSTVSFNKYVEMWTSFGDSVMHMPGLWDWSDGDKDIDYKKPVALHRVEFTRLLSRVSSNMMDYTSQEDWENKDEGSLITFHILRSPDVAKFPYGEGHTYRGEDLFTFFKKQIPAYGWIQLSDDDEDMGYDPTRRYFRFPYPDIWIDEESSIYLTKRLQASQKLNTANNTERLLSFLLVPDPEQKGIKIGSRDGMLGEPSSMHGKSENMYKVFPYERAWDQRSWNAAWIAHLMENPWYSISKISVVEMVRKILASLHETFYEGFSSHTPPPLEDTPGNVLNFIHCGLLDYETNAKTFHLTCHWPLYLYNFGLANLDFVNGVPKFGARFGLDPMTTALTQRIRLHHQLEESNTKMYSVLNEVKSIYKHNYCENEPYQTWIRPSRPFRDLPGSSKFGGKRQSKNQLKTRSSQLKGKIVCIPRSK